MFGRPQFPFSMGPSPRMSRPGFAPRGFVPGQRPNFGLGSRGYPGGMRGGLLSRLFGAGSTRGGGVPPFGPAMGAAQRSGGIMQTIANPQSISNFLTNTQKVLNTASQISPMIQQYGPLVRNLPAMWKIYKGLKNSDEEEQSDKEEKKEQKSVDSTKEQPDKIDAPAKKDESPKRKTSKTIPAASSSVHKTEREKKGISVPKLYI